MTVDIFIPCFIDQIYPETGFNMVKILEKLGVEVNYNNQQTCCGQMAYNSGFWEDAKKIGEKFIRDFPNNRYIVGPSASCAGFVRNYYDEMFYNSALHIEYHQLKKNFYEFTDFVVNVLKVSDIGATFEHSITYHDSCAALREYGLTNQPRELLKHVRGLELREMKDTHTCCGFGGTFCVFEEAVSVKMGKDRIAEHDANDVDYITGGDTSCLMHLEGILKRKGSTVKTIHIAEILNSSL